MKIKYTVHKITKKDFFIYETAELETLKELKSLLYNDYMMAKEYDTPTSDLKKGDYKIDNLQIIFQDNGVLIDYDAPNTIKVLLCLDDGTSLQIAKNDNATIKELFRNLTDGGQTT